MPNTSPRFFNPLMIWTDVALKTGEMLVSSGSVIQLRTSRMAAHGMQPSPADMREIHLMSEEKLAAVTESTAAIANQLHTTSYALVNRAVQQWFESQVALWSLATSFTPVHALTRGQAFLDASTRLAHTWSQLSSAGARVAQRALKPIHAKATDNARRLALAAPAST
ncbi:polyhydroxyalkanoate granule-associated phasin [Variovorax rhizosphaerae]|uniref:Polyhydroxyalkanoate granule-associated phasin n=1 Tax=Variovorax rhizosphaerae TaxID=1836200 RepID=A0ABU8WCY1_9BURK